jgi:hypothetical protein
VILVEDITYNKMMQPWFHLIHIRAGMIDGGLFSSGKKYWRTCDLEAHLMAMWIAARSFCLSSYPRFVR